MDSLISGISSSFSSVLAKIALDATSPIQHILSKTSCGETLEDYSPQCKLADFALRLVFFVTMLSLNALGLSKHIDGMKANGSAAGVALSTCWNFTATVVFGVFLFGERFFLNKTWLAGFGLILIGGLILSTVKVLVPALPKTNSTENSTEYEVERILEKRVRKSHVEYKVHWKNYPVSEATWEPAFNLKNNLAVLEFQESKIRSKSRSRSRSKSKRS
ncbi:hypothetical protein TrLO_g441 [Triparma laevis f. longispina]|uniref:Chromo domain-containing protein n=1 Tax=Triparma laevis f. longispina TaxID=1714387 RepID=A0A9W7E8T6_9STRA|nr:hypothetical protein TrLO_g441 [Triparma laevis f. longispina]